MKDREPVASCRVRGLLMESNNILLRAAFWMTPCAVPFESPLESELQGQLNRPRPTNLI